MLPSPNNDSFPELLTNTPSLDSDAASGEGMFSSWWVWIFIILLLAYLGFNIFNYLAKGAQTTNDVLSPFWAYIMSFFNYGPTITPSDHNDAQIQHENNNDAINADGHSSNQDGGSKPISAENAKPNPASVSKMNPDSAHNQQGPDNAQNTALNRALNISKQQELSKQDYVANDSYDNTKQGKAGWCYIGSEKGYRSCSQVGEADTCMSGNIFPTQDICVNPSLRA